jgi:hypothetical protein
MTIKHIGNGRLDLFGARSEVETRGVKRPVRKMRPADLKRKAGWAYRFGAGEKLPPLVEAKNRPKTRFAVSPRSWGDSAASKYD